MARAMEIRCRSAQQIAHRRHDGGGPKQGENADTEQLGQPRLVAPPKIIADYGGNAVDIAPEQTAEQALGIPDDGQGRHAV